MGGEKTRETGLRVHLQGDLESHRPSSSPLNPGKDSSRWVLGLVHHRSGSG